MEARGDHIAIDVEAITSNLETKLQGNLVLPSHCSIFRIPTILSRHIKISYEPNAFAIGPFHHDNPKLKPTERIKQKYLLDLISRLSNPNNPNSSNPVNLNRKLIENLTKAISDVENDAREYYAGPIDMKGEDFVEMLVLDGCFLIELFRKNAYPHLCNECDPIFTMSCLLQFLHHDLVLLENQIPWLVLDILFEQTEMKSVQKKPLIQLALEFFPSLLKKEKPNVGNVQSNLSIIQNHGSRHILDLLRNSLVLNSDTINKRSNNEWEHIRSATNLRASGITFKKDVASESILDIKFFPKGGVMAIPPLLIQETTETVFRNLISLEQCCPNYKPIITCYAVLLDNLIDTNDDIQLLDKRKVIVNWLNNDDATKLFNRLYIDTYVKENYYYELTTEVNKYCKKSWNTYRRVLKRDYFRHPWASISVIAAFVALVLTFLQTLYTMKA
ncbi:hypothetical protein TorRG33x02_088540 [Trema orientale]|uniref:Uncharacterized protein n=1 Tax=Trema orientale TaxID=63057 RepID=A0A2P5FC23_TREOI|nr:hypothetical protein TorRG33x02_088540 [Trema orientale]